MAKRRTGYFWMLMMVLLWVAPALASDAPTPARIEGAKVIGVEEAERLLAQQPKIFDVRIRADYGRGHLPGATIMPFKEKSRRHPDFDPAADRFGIMQLPSDKNAPVLFYGDGPDDWPSYKAARIAAMAGYSQIYWLRDGYSAWQKGGYAVEK